VYHEGGVSSEDESEVVMDMVQRLVRLRGGRVGGDERFV
jgi:hypothetical protein